MRVAASPRYPDLTACSSGNSDPSLTMLQIDPSDAESSLKCMVCQQDKILRTANSFEGNDNYKYTRFVQCIVFMITGILSIREMTTE